MVRGSKFDGYANGVLQEAKGPGYANFVKNGRFADWWTKGYRETVNQAVRQVRAAAGTPINWYVAEPEAYAAFNRVLFENNINGINVLYAPPIS